MSKDEWKQYDTEAKRKWYNDRRAFVKKMPNGPKKKAYKAFVQKTAQVRDDDPTDYMTEWKHLKAMKVAHKFNPFIV